jgi:hypothetical protein
VRFGDCGRDKLLAFSCKLRGWVSVMPCAPHMAHSGVSGGPHRPNLLVRQCALALPIPLRGPLAAQPERVGPVMEAAPREHWGGAGSLRATVAKA